MKKLIFLSLFLFSQIVSSESNKSDKDLYDLQDKCRKTTDDTFKKEWGSGIVNSKDSVMVASYSNHYNKKLNKCFYLLSSTSSSKNNVIEMNSLWDIQENKSYAEFNSDSKGVFFCHVKEYSCNSKKEWDSLIKSYIND